MFPSAADVATSSEGSGAVGRVAPMKSRTKLRTREKRQSWRMTRRELRKTLKRDARKWVREVWQASAGAAAELEALSPLTAVLGTRLVEDYAASKKLADSELQRALRIVIVAGYGARIVLVDPTNQPALRPASFHLGQRADAEKLAGDAAAVGRLLDDVRTIAARSLGLGHDAAARGVEVFRGHGPARSSSTSSRRTRCRGRSWGASGSRRCSATATSCAALTRRSAPNRSCAICTPSPDGGDPSKTERYSDTAALRRTRSAL